MVGVSPVITGSEESNELRMLAERLKGIPDDGTDVESVTELQSVAQDTLRLLKNVLHSMQLSFVEMGGDSIATNADNESYLAKLKAYRQKLSSPDPAAKERAHEILDASMEHLLSELDSRSREMNTEVLDSLLSLSQTKIYGYRWIVEQLNEGLSSIADDVNVEIGAAFDAANELLGAEVKNIGNVASQLHRIELDQNFGDNRNSSEPDHTMDEPQSYGTNRDTTIQSLLGKVRQRVSQCVSFLRSPKGNMGQQTDQAFKATVRPKIDESMASLKSFVLDSFNDYDENQDKQMELTLQAIDLEINDCIAKMSNTPTADNNKEEKRLYEQINLMESQIAYLKVLLASTIE